MGDDRSAAARLDALEERAAHQELTIAELNDVITQQWKTIDHLNRQVAQMTIELQNLAAAQRQPPEPPPHY